MWDPFGLPSSFVWEDRRWVTEHNRSPEFTGKCDLDAGLGFAGGRGLLVEQVDVFLDLWRRQLLSIGDGTGNALE